MNTELNYILQRFSDDVTEYVTEKTNINCKELENAEDRIADLKNEIKSLKESLLVIKEFVSSLE